MKPVGKPDAGNPHVRFDERGGETGRTRGTAPFLDSTIDAGGAADLGRGGMG
jgi:transposase